jgi:uncharacterized surface protein with fasciclin (FAS1) repeats
MKSRIFPFIFPLLALTLVFSSCEKKDTVPPSEALTNITSQVVAASYLQILESAVVKAKLASTLEGAGPFTVFAPTDVAFTQSGITASTIESKSELELKSLLLYHVIPAKIMASEVPAGPNAKVVTAGGDSVFVTRNSSGVFVNGIKVYQADMAATNGVIHLMSKPLIPPVGNLVEVAQANSDFSYLVAAVLRASTGATNVAEILSSGGPFTLFAPTNSAFMDAGFATINDINAADPDVLTAILTYHVVPGRVFSSDLTNDATPGTANGAKVTIGVSPSGATVKGKSNESASNITAANIMAINGVVHVIDKVLLPPGSITSQVVATSALSILESAVVKAKLASTLDGAGPFTVFAPTDDAFIQSGITSSTIESKTELELQSLLLYHVLPAIVMAADVPAGPNAKVITAGGDSVFVTSNSSGVFVNGISVIQADIEASNGVIHLLSRALLPATGNLVEVAQANPDFSYLVAAVLRASTGATNVAQVLTSAGPYTLFAPTNTAFMDAGFATIDDINAADPDVLAAILTYHVVAGRVFSSDLTNDATPATANGQTVTIGISGSGATVKGMANATASNITAANIMARNGVVHVIDKVLLPQ